MFYIKIFEPGLWPLVLRICLVWLFVFFSDSLVDLLLNTLDFLWGLIGALIDLSFELEGFIALDFIAEQFSLSGREAELVVVYGLFPLKLLLFVYMLAKLCRWIKRMFEQLKCCKSKEITLIENSWLILEWYFKLTIVAGMLVPIVLFFLF